MINLGCMLITKKYILQKNGYHSIFGRWIKITPTALSIIPNEKLKNISITQLKKIIKEKESKFMNGMAQVMLSTVSSPDKVSRNSRIYTKESFENMLKEYKNRFKNLRVPVVIKKAGTNLFEVPLRDIVGHIDMSNPINIGTGSVQVEINNLENLKFLSTNEVEIGMRCLGKITNSKDGVIQTELTKLICFELLPKYNIESLIEEE